MTALHANLLLVTHRLPDAAAAAAEALTEGERLGDPATCGHALHVAAGERGIAGDVLQGVRLLERGTAVVAAEPRLVDLRLMLLGNLAAMLTEADRHEAAEDVLRQARVLAERIGTPRLATVQMQAGVAAFERGRWDDALVEFDALTESGIAGYQHWIPLVVHGAGAVIAVHRDDTPVASGHLDALRDLGFGAGPASDGYVYARLGTALWQARNGSLAEAVDTLAASLEPDRQTPGEREHMLPTLIRLAMEAGKPDIAERAAAVAAADAEQSLFPRAKTVAGWCRGLAESDPEPVHEAAASYRAASRPLQMANALEDAAVLEAQAGHNTEARTALTEAMAAYTDLGAVWDSRRAVARLRAQGLHVGARGPRRRAATGWGALTATEERVAELVAAGCSNSEIAERLVLSRRTVETHVSHILAKLQVGSRREVADFAAGRGPDSMT
jgi:DNA-binding CsgD family transcriptional regulator